MKPGRLITAGEAMVLLVGEPGRSLGLTDSFRAGTAGAETNVAIGLCRLGHDARWLGVLGDDALGDAVLRRLRADRVDVDRVRRDPDRPTGVLIRDVHARRPIEVAYYRSDSAASAWSVDDVDDHDLHGADLLHLSGITPMLSDTCAEATIRLVDLAARADVPVSVDPNVRLRLGDPGAWRERVRPLLLRAHYVFAGHDELDLLEVDTAELLRGEAHTVVVKNADRSATVHQRDAQHTQPPMIVSAVDSVGAGDAFVAGYLSGVLESLPVEQCADRAARAGASAVQSVGDTVGYPTRSQLSTWASSPDGAVRR